MTDAERDAVANFLRSMSLNIEESTYAIRTDPEIASEGLREIASWLCEAADALEALNIALGVDPRSERLFATKNSDATDDDESNSSSPKLH